MPARSASKGCVSDGKLGSDQRMVPFLRDLVADASPGPPLIENNTVFYTVFGAVLLVVLLLVLWLRRAAGRKG